MAACLIPPVIPMADLPLSPEASSFDQAGSRRPLFKKRDNCIQTIEKLTRYQEGER
jgi:hypothetical protein